MWCCPFCPIVDPSGKTSNDFKYLTTQAPAEDMDFTGLSEVQDAVRELGISVEDEKDIFKALGGLLHLGQVRGADSGLYALSFPYFFSLSFPTPAPRGMRILYPPLFGVLCKKNMMFVALLVGEPLSLLSPF